jgi:hypothetical protein
VSGDQLIFTYANLTDATLRFYAMDIELLFSTTPFLAQSSGSSSNNLGAFSFVRPNITLPVALPPQPRGQTAEYKMALPAAVARSNIMVEVVAGTLAPCL